MAGQPQATAKDNLAALNPWRQQTHHFKEKKRKQGKEDGEWEAEAVKEKEKRHEMAEVALKVAEVTTVEKQGLSETQVQRMLDVAGRLERKGLWKEATQARMLAEEAWNVLRLEPHAERGTICLGLGT